MASVLRKKSAKTPKDGIWIGEKDVLKDHGNELMKGFAKHVHEVLGILIMRPQLEHARSFLQNDSH